MVRTNIQLFHIFSQDYFKIDYPPKIHVETF